ncbi:hypothetical protein CN176_03625 [Sinorhizobium medicae]|uniref:FG-GAP repeat domain-containing protein n=1 Tax=Sinorhizobium medicae TaxID=110321 RepID=UPI000FDB3259|nr:VCBS repeat-containing protein [Sinorhizobium medicae]RVJ45882.1 hypothetical protein CN176_03625 [Sinorhizobium medicae]
MRIRMLAIAILANFMSLGPTASDAAPFDVRTFQPWSGYAIPNGEWRLLDFDGDGRKDVVHIVAGSDYVHTWRSVGNGTFTVGTFRPWVGYAMPNGLWLTGDLNADGREDLVHAVQNTSYVHTWISRGDGTFQVGTFRPWPGYAVPNGEWRVVDFNGDHRSDLVHIVNGSGIVHTWRSLGNGTFAVGTFRPWSGYATPNGLWLTGDLNADGRGDLVHAVRNADYVHTWMSRGDGTFQVGTFRPWAGYAIPNGEWRSLDFDGDGRADLVHVVAGAGIVHTWRSLGNGAFTVGTFQPWPGYLTPNGLWLAGDLDADGREDLMHAVNNSTYVHTWLSKGDGTFRVGTFSPWNGYAVPNGLWLTGDLTGDRKVDILHAVANSSIAHPWLSTLPRPGEFALDGLEITQGIQNMAHEVALIEAKPTAVRVYPAFNGTGIRQVRGRLWVRNTSGAPWQLLNSQNAATVDAAENGNIRVKRENTDRGLNFILPPAVLAQGTLVAWFQDLSDAITGSAIACSDCATTNRTMPVAGANPMRLRVLGMSYVRGTPPQTFQPTTQDFVLTQSWLRRAYPTGDLRMTSGTVTANATPPFGCGDANAQLTAIRNADVAGGSDQRTHYYGIVFEDGSANSFFMRGCAAGIPSSPSPGTVASGPTGPGTWGWDNDGSYGDWYTGHELGHTYGRLHIGSGCGETSDDPNYPHSNGRISGEDGAFVGFDTGDAVNGVAIRALPGRDWSDVMSYCSNQWISAYTYNHIRTRLVAENALPAGPEPRVAGRQPIDAAAGVGPAAAMAAPPDIVEGELGQPASQGVGGAEITMLAPAYAQPNLIEATRKAPPDLPDPAMTVPAEIILGQAIQGGPTDAREAPPSMETAEGRPRPTDPSAAPADVQPMAPSAASSVERTLQKGDFLVVAASVNLTKKTANIVDARRLDQALVPVGDPGSALVLRGLNAAGAEIGRWNVPFLANSEREPGEDLIGVLDAVVPFPEGLKTVEVVVDGKAADTFTAPDPGALTSLDADIQKGVEVTEKRANAVTLEIAGGGGRTPEGVTYDVQASTDGGATWTTVGIGLTEPVTTVDISGLGAKGAVQLRVMVKEGFEQRVVDTVEVQP